MSLECGVPPHGADINPPTWRWCVPHVGDGMMVSPHVGWCDPPCWVTWWNSPMLGDVTPMWGGVSLWRWHHRRMECNPKWIRKGLRWSAVTPLTKLVPFCSWAALWSSLNHNSWLISNIIYCVSWNNIHVNILGSKFYTCNCTCKIWARS